MITSFIVLFTVVIAVSGVAVVVWSLLSTRKEYYQDYVGRKKMIKNFIYLDEEKMYSLSSKYLRALQSMFLMSRLLSQRLLKSRKDQ